MKKDSEYRYMVTLWSSADFEFGHSDFERVAIAHVARCSGTYALDLQVVDTLTGKVIVRWNRRGRSVTIDNPTELYKEYIQLKQERAITPTDIIIPEPVKKKRGRPPKAPK